MPELPVGSTKRGSGVGLSDLLAATAAGANRGERRSAFEPAAPGEAGNDRSDPTKAQAGRRQAATSRRTRAPALTAGRYGIPLTAKAATVRARNVRRAKSFRSPTRDRGRHRAPTEPLTAANTRAKPRRCAGFPEPMMPERPAGSTKRRSGVGLSDLLAATAAGANRGTRRIALEPAALGEARNDQSDPT